MSGVNSILSKRWPWLTAAAIVLVAYAAWMIDVDFAPRDDRPVGSYEDIERLRDRDDVNVLFILIDTLRADRLHAWGYDRETSPLFDRIAASGVRFDRHVAQSSWTKCSMASLWTGLYPSRTGVTRFEHVLNDEAKLPAEILREAGFRTAGLFRNGWVESYFGFGQGFEVYAKPVGGRPSPSVKRENPTLSDAGTDTSAIDGAREFLHTYGDQRWFLYLHLMDLHEYLYDEDSARFGTAYSDVYDNSILRVNLVLEDLFTYLAQAGHLDDTLVVIASDHGEAFSERGYEGHARYVYKETTHVPLIIGFPFRLEPGVVIEHTTRNVDVWPTILDLLGLPSLTDPDGRSQRDAIIAAAGGPPVETTQDGPAWAHLDRTWGRRGVSPAPTVSVVDEGYRYVRLPTGGGEYSEELFDLDEDAAELTDLHAERAEVVERLRASADAYLQREAPWTEAAPPLEMDEIQLQQLRALGYKVP